VGLIVFGKAEAVAPHHYSVLEQNVVSQLAEFPYYGVGVGKENHGHSAARSPDTCNG
jgi:hypothetical protein